MLGTVGLYRVGDGFGDRANGQEAKLNSGHRFLLKYSRFASSINHRRISS